MQKLMLKVSLTAFALILGPLLTFAKQQSCAYMAGTSMVTWSVPGGNCCSPTSGIGFGTISWVDGDTYSSEIISVQRAQRYAGCPLVYNPQ